MTQDDYVRTDQLADALIPLEVVREILGIPRITLYRKLKAANIPTQRFHDGSAVLWSDLVGTIIRNP